MKSAEVADIFFRNYVLIGGIFVSIEQIGSAGMQQQLLNNTTVNNNHNVGTRAVTLSDKIQGSNESSQSNFEGERGFTPSERQVQDAVDSTNKELEKLETNLRFSVHKKTKQIMIKIIDTKTEEVIKELPPEKLLDMVASMMERAGLIIDKKG